MDQWITDPDHARAVSAEARTAWRVEAPGLGGSLVFAYDGRVVGPALQMTHPAPPLTAWMVRRGAVSVMTGPSRLQIGPGEWILLPARPRVHSMEAATHLLSVRFHLWRGQEENIPFRPTTLVGTDHPGLETAARRLVAWVESLGLAERERRSLPPPDQVRGAQPGFLAAYALWMEQVVEALTLKGEMGPKNPLDPRLAHLLDRRPEEGSSTHFTVAALAKSIGLSTSHLKRLFKEGLQESPSAWILRRRLIRARELLSDPQLQVKMVAARLGFSSAAHFSNWFRQHHGATPSSTRDHPAA